jgi:hypothetical protein
MPHMMVAISLVYKSTIFYLFLWGRTKFLGTAATSGLLYKPQMTDEDDCGAIGGKQAAP